MGLAGVRCVELFRAARGLALDFRKQGRLPGAPQPAMTSLPFTSPRLSGKVLARAKRPGGGLRSPRGVWKLLGRSVGRGEP